MPFGGYKKINSRPRAMRRHYAIVSMTTKPTKTSLQTHQETFLGDGTFRGGMEKKKEKPHKENAHILPRYLFAIEEENQPRIEDYNCLQHESDLIENVGGCGKMHDLNVQTNHVADWHIWRKW